MDIHEHQAKDILKSFGVPVPRGALAYSPEQAAYRARELGGDAWVVMAQVHSGGRGEAGGVKLCRSDAEVAEFARGLLGRQLVTKQTDAGGKGVYRLWVEEATDIAKELYLGFVLDRKSERIMIVASGHGGMEIEDLAEEDPDSLVRMVIDPAVGLALFQARELGFRLGLEPRQVDQFLTFLRACNRAYRDLDAMMVEINPLVITGAGDLVALDAKMSFDGNALYKHPGIAALRDTSQEDPREAVAADNGLAYVGLEGGIGCIINGGGLAMASMDMIQLAGGAPANFLDIGGGASPERVCQAFRTVLSDQNVSVILVNIFAGINRCDWIAKGVVQAYRDIGIGGDPINGSSFKDILELFENDTETDAVMMVGEIGGPQEAEAADYVRDHMTKPVAAYIAGLAAPKGRQMGHAGAIISAFGESAQEKVEILSAVGITVAPNPSSMGETMARVLGTKAAA